LPTSDREPVEPLVSLEELVWLHTVAVTEFGGSQGIRDRGLLESAIARPLAAFGGKDLYDTPFKRASALAESLVMNHGFVDGNKRTGFVIGVLFLELHGFDFKASEADATQAVMALAAGTLDEAAFTTWLRENAKRKRGR